MRACARPARHSRPRLRLDTAVAAASLFLCVSPEVALARQTASRPTPAGGHENEAACRQTVFAGLASDCNLNGGGSEPACCATLRDAERRRCFCSQELVDVVAAVIGEEGLDFFRQFARALLDKAHRARSVFARDGERRALRDASRTHSASGGGLRVRSVGRKRRRHVPEPAGTRCLRNAGESRPRPADGSVSVRRSGKCFSTRFRVARDAGADLRLPPRSVAGRSPAASLYPSFAPPASPSTASLRDAGARAAALHPAARAAARLGLRAAASAGARAAAQDPGSALSGGGAVFAAPRARLRFFRGRAQSCRPASAVRRPRPVHRLRAH